MKTVFRRNPQPEPQVLHRRKGGVHVTETAPAPPGYVALPPSQRAHTSQQLEQPAITGRKHWAILYEEINIMHSLLSLIVTYFFFTLSSGSYHPSSFWWEQRSFCLFQLWHCHQSLCAFKQKHLLFWWHLQASTTTQTENTVKCLQCPKDLWQTRISFPVAVSELLNEATTFDFNEGQGTGSKIRSHNLN